MADVMRLMAEANIRDWQRRVDAGEVDPNAPRLDLASDSFENLIYKEIVAHYERAAAASDESTRKALIKKANDQRIQLLVGIERERPLLAQTLDAKLGLAARKARGM